MLFQVELERGYELFRSKCEEVIEWYSSSAQFDELALWVLYGFSMEEAEWFLRRRARLIRTEDQDDPDEEAHFNQKQVRQQIRRHEMGNTERCRDIDRSLFWFQEWSDANHSTFDLEKTDQYEWFSWSSFWEEQQLPTPLLRIVWEYYPHEVYLEKHGRIEEEEDEAWVPGVLEHKQEKEDVRLTREHERCEEKDSPPKKKKRKINVLIPRVVSRRHLRRHLRPQTR